MTVLVVVVVVVDAPACEKQGLAPIRGLEVCAVLFFFGRASVLCLAYRASPACYSKRLA